MGMFDRPKSLSELEEDREHGEAEVGVLKQRLIKKRIEEKLGKGGMNMFKTKGGDSRSMFQRAYNWLKSH